MPSNDEVAIQRAYYKSTAQRYDSVHVREKDEHYFALRFLETAIDHYGIASVLDVGAGTGRVACYLKAKYPALKVISVEPVKELREIGYSKGLTKEELIEGDATRLQFQDSQFDLVCEFGILHHVRNPASVVAEMLRVGRVGIFISDSNNFGQGSFVSRTVKQLLDALGLWRIADLIKTRGKGYEITEGDGLAYSYSVFNNYAQIARACYTHIFNTEPAGINPYRTAPHIALLGIKK
ncbi:MAG: class I SAM-dependent methyltransferase [Alphaproteobacteria bacterium]